MRQIAREVDENPELVLSAPHETRISRLDEVMAARKPILRYTKRRSRKEPHLNLQSPQRREDLSVSSS